MCRIAGIASIRPPHKEHSERLSVMLNAMAHGGPDDEGYYQEGSVALGHRRLSILDLSSAGHQPMSATDAQVVISFNGEIYNFQALKIELEKVGVAFRTRTDTEVILNAYQHWGPAIFERLQGIFAFALYDKKINKLFLVRDQLGVKPLYYSLTDQELIFSSEVKAFKALDPDWRENPDWRILFLAFGSLPHPATTLAGVYQLQPGTYLELPLENFVGKTVCYYTPDKDPAPVSTIADHLSTTKTAVQEAFQKNMISDAPVGVFLSGGIDSSLLTLLADQLQQNIKTISVNFEDASFDERPYQQIVLEKATHVDHISYLLTEKMFWDQLEEIWRAMDQPSIDGVNSFFVSQCAKNEGLKVVLSGLGADEIFGGYQSTSRITLIKWLRMLPLKRMLANIIGFRIKMFKRLMYLTIPGAVGDYLFLRGVHTPDTIASFLGIPEEKIWKALAAVKVEVPANLSDKEYASLLETRIYMTNQLLKDTDYMSMWHALEVRVPFLDTELIKKIKNIIPSEKYKKNWPKYLLTASYQDLLPADIIFRKKRGFTFPFSLWIRRSATRFRALLPSGTAVDKIMFEFEKGQSHWSKCWSLAVIKQFKY
jgi:asparagine synthase (glutamine-hydrolysing)